MAEENAELDVENAETIDTEQTVETEVETEDSPETVEEVLDALEPQSHWPYELREQFAKWSGLAGEGVSGRDVQQRFLDYAKSSETQLGEVGNKMDMLNRQYQPIQSVLDRYQDDFALAKMEPHTAVNNALTFAQKTASDPSWGIQYIAKQYGIDLAKLIEETPYQDPAVANLMQPMQREIADLRRQLDDRNQQKQESFYQDVRQAALKFENAEENGKPKYPYVHDVAKEMLSYAGADIEAGRVPNYAELYERACYANPDIRQRMIAEQAKQYTSQATASAQKAKEASKTVKGTGDGKAPKPLPSVSDSVKEAAEKLYA